MGEKEIKYTIPLAARLRNQGISCEIYPDNLKLKKQFEYADKKGIKYFVIIGAEEMEQEIVTIKDLNSGTQHKIKKEQIFGYLYNTDTKN